MPEEINDLDELPEWARCAVKLVQAGFTLRHVWSQCYTLSNTTDDFEECLVCAPTFEEATIKAYTLVSETQRNKDES